MLETGPSRMGVCGGCDTPPENKLSANEGICWQTKNNIPQNVKLNQFFGQYSLHSRAILAYNKEKWDKLCQFCEKLCYFVISGKFSCLEKFGYGRKHFWTPKMVY
jgi:N-acetylneuraminic acid mutarotase